MAFNTDGVKGNRTLYRILAEGLGQLSEDGFQVLGQRHTYHSVFKDYALEESVRSFYSL